MNDRQAVNRSRAKLLLLLAVFLLPIVAAYVIHKNPEWMPKSTKNYGVLYKPTINLKSFTMQTVDGKAFDLDKLRGKWSLIYIGAGSCDRACEETLIKARDARWGQGTEAGRINYYYVLDADKFTGDLSKLEKNYPGMIFLHGDEQQRMQLLQQFQVDKNQQPGSDNRLYLVDPAGVLLMHYPYGFRHIGLMEDLKYLLKWSQLG